MSLFHFWEKWIHFCQASSSHMFYKYQEMFSFSSKELLTIYSMLRFTGRRMLSTVGWIFVVIFKWQCSVNPYGLSNLEKLRSTCGFSVSMKSWSYPKKVVDLNEAKSFNTFRWRLKLGIIHLLRRQNFLKTNISFLLIRTT